MIRKDWLEHLRFECKCSISEPVLGKLLEVVAAFGRIKSLRAAGEGSIFRHASPDKFLQVDRYIYEDIKSGPPQTASGLSEPDFWSYSREDLAGRMPWLGFILYDSEQSVYLKIRWGGDVNDPEDPPKWLQVPVSFTSGYGEVSKKLQSARILAAYFLLQEGNSLVGGVEVSVGGTDSEKGPFGIVP